MKVYNAAHIRNVAILGHGGEGKTSLAEAMLFASGAIDRMGKTDDGNTITDYDEEEIKRHYSISAALAPIEWKDQKINLLDTPGYFDFEGEVLAALEVADSGLIVMNAASGLTIGAQKAWKLCKDRNLPRAIVANRMDNENADFQNLLDELIDAYGTAIAPMQWPIFDQGKFSGFVDLVQMKAKKFEDDGLIEIPIPSDLDTIVSEYRKKLIEAAAENDDELLEKYFDSQELSEKEIHKGLRIGILSSEIAPVFCTAAVYRTGVGTLMNYIIHLFPTPLMRPDKKAKNEKGEDILCKCDEKSEFAAQIFKTMTDNYVGKISLFRVYSGKIKAGDTVYNPRTQKYEKISAVYYMRGKKTYPFENGLAAGDIGAFAKLQHSETSDTLCESSFDIVFPPLQFPETVFFMAVSAAKSGEEDKVFAGIQRLLEEDPTFALEHSQDSNQTLLKGMGEMHLDVIVSKVKNKFNAEANLQEPKIPYRETIRKGAKAQGRHKKQSGGSGQFGDVWIEFQPILDGEGEFEFVDKVVGGSVPRNFIPAVEKGLRDAMQEGVLAGYPSISVRATLYDGSSHSVDSNEMAFRQAAKLAYRKGMLEASPYLLEPVYRYDVLVPEDSMGDIIGDLNRRRGRILGMDQDDQGQQVVSAEVPLSEMFKYATDLRSMTQGRGNFRSYFIRFEEVPDQIAKKIIESSENKAE